MQEKVNRAPGNIEISMAELKITKSGKPVDLFVADSTDNATEMSIPAVIDVDADDSIIGCEIVNLKHKFGRQSAHYLEQMTSARDRFPRFSYDSDVDACYLQFKNGVAARTESLDASATLDSQGRIIKLRVMPRSSGQ